MPSSSHAFRAFCTVSLISVAAFLSSCASIVHGGPRTITFNTQPAGAKVIISKVGTAESVHSGVTPFTVSLETKQRYFKGQPYTARFELAGYKTQEIQLTPQLSGWYFGNIVFGGLIGMLIVDPLTGSMWNLSPDKIDRTLNAEQAAVLKSGQGFIVAMISDVSEAERAKMVKLN